MKHLSGAPLYGGLLALPTNIRLGWKGLPGANTESYFINLLFTTVKRIITLATGGQRNRRLRGVLSEKLKAFFLHFLFPGASSRTRTLALRVMSRLLHHCATADGPKSGMLWFQGPIF